MTIYTIQEHIRRLEPKNCHIRICEEVWGEGENEAHHVILLSRAGRDKWNVITNLTGEVYAQDLRV